MSHYNSVVCGRGPKFTIFWSNVEGVVVDDGFFPTFDVTIRSEDNRDQSRKLSEIEPNFGRFFALPNFSGGPSENGTHIITPALRHVDWKTFREDTPTSPAHTLNFRPYFKLSRLIFFFLGGDPVPVGVCAR